MIRLYSDNPGETYTDKGNQLDMDITRLIGPFIRKACDEGVSMRDLSYIVKSAIDIEICCALIGKGIEARKAAREGRENA